MIGGVLYDHTVTVWRFRESESSTLRVKERRWAPVSGEDGVRLSIQTRRESWDNPGGGQKAVGEYSGYGPPNLDILEGDVLEVYEGPEAPMKVEVDSARRPRGHHTELVLISWQGSLS